MKIYVLIPYGLVTGGPDALHQLVYYLNKLKFNTCAVYLGASKNEEIPKQYKTYINDYLLIDEVIDDKDNIIVIPEFISYLKKDFKKSRIFIWWLSVDYNLNKTSIFYKMFFFFTIPLRLIKNRRKGYRWILSNFKNAIKKEKYSFKNESNNVTHLCASYYAYDYVSSRSKNRFYLCIEPISKFFLEKSSDGISYSDREDIVLYNPAKCGKFVEKIIEKAPNIKFVALRGMSQSQLIDYYKKAKVYIDFGPFPGAERMPKEAVLFGCTILTGKNGASAYYGDVPIYDEYKLENSDNNIGNIIEKIKYMLSNYDSIINDFSAYKTTVLNLENQFLDQLMSIFLNNEMHEV